MLGLYVCVFFVFRNVTYKFINKKDGNTYNKTVREQQPKV